MILDDINAALALEPDNPAFLSGRAGVWVAIGNFDQAISDCTAAIRFNPNYANAHYNLGVAQSWKGDEDRAILSLKKAFSLDPSLKERGRKTPLLSRLLSKLRHFITGTVGTEEPPDYDRIILQLRNLLQQEKIHQIYAYVAAHIFWFDRDFMAYLSREASSEEAKIAGAGKILTVLYKVVQGARFTACLGKIGPHKLSEMTSDPNFNESAAEKFVRDLFQRCGEVGVDVAYAAFYRASQSADLLGGPAVDRRNLHLLLDAAKRYGASEQTALEL